MNGVKKVLIVDDAKDIGRMIAAALATLDPNLQVKVIPSAEEAFIELSHETIDLLVIDIRLPGISGLELTRRVRSRNAGVKIIQISGINEPQIKEHAIEAGANAFFHKPLSMNDFLKAASNCLGLQPAPLPPVEPVPDLKAGDNTPRLADMLTELRKVLGASAAGLINEGGRFVVLTGNLPDPAIETTLIPTLVEAISASQKVTVPMGKPSTDLVLTFRGSAYNLLAAPVNGGMAVIAFLKVEKSSLRMAIALEEMLSVQNELTSLFTEPAMAKHPAHEAPAPAAPMPPRVVETLHTTKPTRPIAAAVEEERQPADALDALLRSTPKRMKPDELNAFWDDLANQQAAEGPSGPDTLSYDQASQLGLTPKDSG
jgi:CheY-like chemotaxis protein